MLLVMKNMHFRQENMPKTKKICLQNAHIGNGYQRLILNARVIFLYQLMPGSVHHGFWIENMHYAYIICPQTASLSYP